jgi:hypothetical protein
MAAAKPVVLSQYEGRLKTVADAIQAHSKLGAKTADAIAVQVLHELDTIPEKLR